VGLKNPEEYTQLGAILVKTSGNNPEQLINYIQGIWHEYNPELPFEYSFLDQTYNNLYRKEVRIGKILNYFSILAVIISCLGLFGLATFMAERRTKEIGIRKVNGADLNSIIAILFKEFSLWVLISFLIAAPIAWFTMHKVFQQYAYRTDISWWIFAVTLLITLLIAWLVVSYNSVKAALANPVESLRNE